jgi:hypothetical protein
MEAQALRAGPAAEVEIRPGRTTTPKQQTYTCFPYLPGAPGGIHNNPLAAQARALLAAEQAGRDQLAAIRP